MKLTCFCAKIPEEHRPCDVCRAIPDPPWTTEKPTEAGWYWVKDGEWIFSKIEWCDIRKRFMVWLIGVEYEIELGDFTHFKRIDLTPPEE